MQTGILSRVILLVSVLLLTACASPNMSGELEVGKRAFKSGDYQKAFHELLPVAKAGRPEAQYAVGYMYYYGYGVPRDVSAGLFWINRAAAQHYPMAYEALERIHHGNTGLDEAITTPVTTPIVKTEIKPVPLPHVHHVKVKKTIMPVMTTVAMQHSCTAPSARYVLQFYGSWQQGSVKAFQKQQKLQGQTSVCMTRREGKNWYVLVMGQFTTAAAAGRTKAALPYALKSLHPWVRETKGLNLPS